MSHQSIISLPTELIKAQIQPLPCRACVTGGFPCIVNPSKYYGCLGCKATNKGCVNCPRIDTTKPGGKASTAALGDPKWCSWISAVHLAESILQMRDPEGPRGVLPDYTGVKLPKFPNNLLWEMNVCSNAEAKIEWDDLKDDQDLFDDYMGAPYQKVAFESTSIVRSRWPKFPKDAPEQVKEILKEMRQQTSQRPWVKGYTDGIIKANFRRVKSGRNIKKEEASHSDGETLGRSRSQSVPPSQTKASRRREASVPPPKRQDNKGKAREEEPERSSRSKTRAAATIAPPPPKRVQYVGLLPGRRPDWSDRLREGNGKAPSVTDDDEGKPSYSLNQLINVLCLTLSNLHSRYRKPGARNRGNVN